MSFSLNQSNNGNYLQFRDDSHKFTHFSNISITRYPDESSFQLMSFVTSHRVTTIRIEFEGDTHYAEATDYSPGSAYSFELEDATILSLSMIIDDEGNNLERIEIGFNILKSKYAPFNIEGKKDSPWMFAYSNEERR